MKKGFKKKQIKYITKVLPLLTDICNVRSQKEMKKLLKNIDLQAVNFLRECIYNAMINTDNLFGRDQITFLQNKLQNNKKCVLYLYQFVFQDVNNVYRCHCFCKCHKIIIIILSMLLPIFKIVTEK